MNNQALAVKDLAEIFEVDVRSITTWKSEPGFPEADLNTNGTRKTWKLQPVIEWYANREVERYKRKITATPESQAQAQLRKTLGEAERVELANEKEKLSLVSAEDVRRTWTQALSRFKDTLMRSSSSFAQDIVSLPVKDFNNIKQAYNKNASQALEELISDNVSSNDNSIDVDFELPLNENN